MFKSDDMTRLRTDDARLFKEAQRSVEAARKLLAWSRLTVTVPMVSVATHHDDADAEKPPETAT